MYGSTAFAKPSETTDRPSRNGLFSKKTLDLLCLASVILVPAVWSLLTFDKVVLISDGWYHTYSRMVLDGMVPYRDFELVFPPPYLYLHVLVLSVFGENMIAFRVIGVFLFIGIAVVSYHIFKLIFPSWVAAIAALVAIFTMSSSTVFAAHDYSRFYDLFNYLSFFFLLRVVVKMHKKEHININLNLLSAGIFCAVALLFRQSSGVIVFAYFSVFLILAFFLFRIIGLRRRNICSFFIGFSVPILITALLLAAAGALVPFIDTVFLSGTKGSVSDMLFGWIPWTFIGSGMIFAVTLISIAAAACLAALVRKRRIDTDAACDKHDCCLYYVFAVSVPVLILISFFLLTPSLMIPALSRYLLAPMFIIDLALVLIFLYNIITDIRANRQASGTDITYLFFCGFILALGFGSGTSGGLSPEQAALNFGLVIAIVLTFINRLSQTTLRTGLRIAATGFAVLLIATSVSAKVVAPYTWWELTAEPYSDSVYGTDIDFFYGLKLTADEKYVYEDFVNNWVPFLGDGDEIYCYPHVAVFYTLADKVPTVRAPIAWFDVASDKAVLEDLEYMKANNPKMIVFADHGYKTLEEHEKAFRGGGESGQRAMYEWLLECRDGAGSSYTTVQHYFIQNYDVYILML